MMEAIKSDKGRNLCNCLKRNYPFVTAQKTQLFRSTEQLWLEGTSGSCQVQPSAQSSVTSRHVAQGHAQLGFEYLQWQRLHSLSGLPVTVFKRSHSGKKKNKQQKIQSDFLFLLFKKNVLYFNLCPFTTFESHISLHSQNRFLAKVYSAGKINQLQKAHLFFLQKVTNCTYNTNLDICTAGHVKILTKQNQSYSLQYV